MGEYNKSIEELLKDFEDLRISAILKQVNMQSGVPTGSNHPNPNPFYEQGEASNSFQSRKPRNQKDKKRQTFNSQKRQAINEEFKPKNPLLQEVVPTWRYFLNMDCATEIRKALKLAMVLNLVYEPAYAEE